ncbi:unnamed protein product [Peniophora sp. CBMAI 1063]|nr:unnamed protein product [Peniophora sp. CBMAI 1063]
MTSNDLPSTAVLMLQVEDGVPCVKIPGDTNDANTQSLTPGCQLVLSSDGSFRVNGVIDAQTCSVVEWDQGYGWGITYNFRHTKESERIVVYVGSDPRLALSVDGEVAVERGTAGWKTMQKQQ